MVVKHFGRTLFVLAAFLILCDLSAWAGEKQGATLVKSITRAFEELGDLSQVLNISRVVGTCELANKASSFNLRLDFYHQGKKLDNQTVVRGLTLLEGVESVQCAVHVVDLDYLPLGGGKPGHERIHFRLGAGTMVAGASFDIAKSDFNATRGAAINIFNASFAKGNEVPLFYAIANSHSISSGRTPAEVVRGNPDADIFVVILEVKLGEKKQAAAP